jgi:hypothetical protein
LTAKVRFHASTVVSTMLWRAIVPALLTRMCSLPKRVSAAATDSFHDASSATSWRKKQGIAALAAEPLRQRLAGGSVGIGQHHRTLFPHKQLGLRHALPAGGAGDQCHFARQSRHFCAPTRR